MQVKAPDTSMIHFMLLIIQFMTGVAYLKSLTTRAALLAISLQYVRKHSESLFARHRQCPACSLRTSSVAVLPLAEPVTESIGRDDVEDSPGRAAVLLDGEIGELFLETIGSELSKQRRQILHVESTTIL